MEMARAVRKGAREGLEVPGHTKSKAEPCLCRVLHGVVQVWSQSCVEAGCRAHMGEHSLCYGESNRHVGSATSAGFLVLCVVKTV